MGGLQRRRRRGEASAARRRRRVARQQLRRHADEPRRRSRQRRDAEGAARSRRERRLAQCRRTDRAPGGGAEPATSKPRSCCSSHGATVDAKEKWGGQTALMWASARRHPEMMQLLISKGADVNARSIDRNYQRHVTGRGSSQEPRQRRTDAAALCRTRELHGVRGRAAQEQGGHRPAGSRRRLAAARGDHERQLGPRAAADHGRRRRQSVGHLSAKRRCSRRSICATASTADGRPSIRSNKTTGLAIVKLLLERGANPNMQLFFKPANAARRDRHARRHAADPRGHQRRSRGREAAARAWRRRDDLHGRPADADPCRARRPRRRSRRRWS